MDRGIILGLLSLGLTVFVAFAVYEWPKMPPVRRRIGMGLGIATILFAALAFSFPENEAPAPNPMGTADAAPKKNVRDLDKSAQRRISDKVFRARKELVGASGPTNREVLVGSSVMPALPPGQTVRTPEVMVLVEGIYAALLDAFLVRRLPDDEDRRAPFWSSRPAFSREEMPSYDTFEGPPRGVEVVVPSDETDRKMGQVIVQALIDEGVAAELVDGLDRVNNDRQQYEAVRRMSRDHTAPVPDLAGGQLAVLVNVGLRADETAVGTITRFGGPVTQPPPRPAAPGSPVAPLTPARVAPSP